MVTGANQHIGFATMNRLIEVGAHVTIVCRDRDRGEKATATVQASSGDNLPSLIVCELSLDDTRQLADECKSSRQPLHGLILNAPVLVREWITPPHEHEITFATNTLDPAGVTHFFMTLLQQPGKSQTVNIISGGQFTEELHNHCLNSEDVLPFDGLAI
jgi:NAD(P)-dependent dehydrogenase (short-subunit alcohol dehydrogenase family)